MPNLEREAGRLSYEPDSTLGDPQMVMQLTFEDRQITTSHIISLISISIFHYHESKYRF
ncbi:hypothetical protein EMIT0P176_10135 [Pseudomonas sp. IT-P176]